MRHETEIILLKSDPNLEVGLDMYLWKCKTLEHKHQNMLMFHKLGQVLTFS